MKYLNILNLALFIMCMGIISSCSKKTELAPDKSWVKVYNHSDFNLVFYPLDLVELPDGRFIILASKKLDDETWPTPYLLCTDNTGNVSWKLEVDANYWAPVPNIIAISGSYYFICTDQNKNTYALKINTEGGAPTVTNISTNVSDLSYTYPLHIFKTSDNTLILTSYNFTNYSNIVTCFNSGFSVLWSTSTGNLEDYNDLILDYLTKRSNQLNFYGGEVNSGGTNYYFTNGIINSLLSLQFLNKSNGSSTGGILGNGLDLSVSSLIQRGENIYILTRFTESQNFISTNPTIDLNSSVESSKIEGIDWPEISPKAVVKNLKTTINGKEEIVICTTTRANKVLVMLFDPLTGVLHTSKYLGSTYPVYLSGIIATNDGGLAVLTQTDVAESFPRIQLYKIPPEDLKY